MVGPGEEGRLTIEPAHDQRLVARDRRRVRIERVARQEVAVDDRPVAAGREIADPVQSHQPPLGLERRLRLKARRGDLEQLPPVGRRKAELVQDEPRGLGRRLG